MRHLIRGIVPKSFLAIYRSWARSKKRKDLSLQKKKGLVLGKENLINDFRCMGLKEGDVLMVHSSLSSIGYVEGGASTVVEALIGVLGPTGHLLMPSAPNASYQLDYIRTNSCFDVLETPSALGAVTECFRKWPGVIRSAHPTEPVCCFGPNASWFVESHFGQPTPYNNLSPFRKVIEAQGKVLYLGVTLANAGTHLHTLEDAVENFNFSVYYPEEFEVSVIFPDRSTKKMLTKVHDPVQSKERRCDELIPIFENEGALQRVKLGNARCLLVDASQMFETMVKYYYENGVTMYTPEGS